MARRAWAIFLLIFGAALITDSIARMVEAGAWMIGPTWWIVIGLPLLVWGMGDLRRARPS
jgi:hypothetical protein